MTVDLKVKHVPSYNVASLMRIGPYKPEILKEEFNGLTKWARKNHLNTGKWILYFLDEGGRRPENKRRWEACLEIKNGEKTIANLKTNGTKIKIKKIPKVSVVSVKFNPEKVSARLVYHGVYGWLDENEEGYKSAGKAREIYLGNPWKDSWAWARAEVQVPIRKK